MKAMILAAGLGTRLRPLTDDRPKALVEVAGHTLLEITLNRLRAFGIQDVIVNAHHYADMIVDYLKANQNFGMRIEVSREEELLDTGADSKEPFLLHNVDIISTIDFSQIVRFHVTNDALATLAVQKRQTSRYLLFDEQGQLCGRRSGSPEVGEVRQDELVRPAYSTRFLAFSGIHVISSRIFAEMKEEGSFSIIKAYLNLAARGEKIIAFRADGSYWRDLGRPANVSEASEDIRNGQYSVA